MVARDDALSAPGNKPLPRFSPASSRGTYLAIWLTEILRQ
jgi:hypothetical protein